MSDKALVHGTASWNFGATWARVGATLLDICDKWQERARTRRDLARMNGRDLHDIGLCATTARDEIQRPLWADYSPEWQIAGKERRACFAARPRG